MDEWASDWMHGLVDVWMHGLVDGIVDGWKG